MIEKKSLFLFLLNVSIFYMVDLGLSSQICVNFLIKLVYLWLKILVNLFITFNSSFVTNIGNSEVSIDFTYFFSDWVCSESTGIVILIEDSNPGRNKIHIFHLFNLIFFFLPWSFPFFWGQLINIEYHSILFFRKKIFEDFINFFDVLVLICLFRVMK